MKSRLILLTVLLWAPSVFAGLHEGNGPGRGDRRFQIHINKNVELLGLVYFLGYEGAQSQTSGYSAKTRARYAFGLHLYRQYKEHESSRNLSVVIAFAQDIWLDYFIALLVQLDDVPSAKLTDRIDISYYRRFSSTSDPVEAKRNVSDFIEAMNRLYREVDFDNYLMLNRKKYDNAAFQVNNGLPDNLFIPAMERFYQNHLDSYVLVPSLTIPPGMGFGVKHTANGQTHAFHVFGAFGIPSFADESYLDMGFNDKKHLLELSTHEFGHSFVNPAIDRLPPGLIKETEALFNPVKDKMADQGYTTWKACLSEHFVRAGEIIIAQNLGNAADAERLKEHYIQDRRFIYLPMILREFEAYTRTPGALYGEAVDRAMGELLREVPKH
jgi:hypothetical protein